jgi:hypothetical protein
LHAGKLACLLRLFVLFLSLGKLLHLRFEFFVSALLSILLLTRPLKFFLFLLLFSLFLFLFFSGVFAHSCFQLPI